MLDYLRLSPMIGGGSLSLKANERTTTRERQGRDNKMKCNECERDVEVADGIALCHYHYTNENLCGDCLIPISQCAHKLYLLDELEKDANRLIQLTKEREKMK